MKNKSLFLIFGILLISFVSSATLSLTPNPTSVNLEFGQSSSVVVSYTISNIGLAGQYGVNLLGSPKLISYSGGSISYSENTTTTGSITININGNASGDFVNYINIGDQSVSLPIHVSQQVSQYCAIDIFPLTLTNVKIKTGEIKTRNIQLSIPSCYPSSVSVSGVTLATDEKPLILGELSLGLLSPGSSVNIPIEINAIDVATGQYSDTLSFLLYNSTGGRINVPNVGISVYVSQGISPVNNETFSNPPSCTLSSTTLNLNSSATFTCSNVFQNIKVNPQYNEFFVGQGVDYSGSIYTYTFKPVKFGNINFIAIFTYDNSPIFNPFVQEVKISSTGTQIAGTELKLLFTPTLDTLNNGQQTIIQLIDNKTNSLVETPEIYINAVRLTSLNSSDKSFPFNMNFGTNYEVRGKAPGYSDLVQIVNVTSKPLSITLEPSLSQYLVGDYVNLTSNVENVTFLFDNVIVTSPYTFVSEGEHILQAVKEGYISYSMNVSVKPSIYFSAVTPNDMSKWKKGDSISMTLTEDASWSVLFNDTIINSGTGKDVSFKIENYGIYKVMANDKLIISPSIEKNTKFLDWIKKYWYILAIIGGVIVLLIIILLIRGGGSESNGGVPLGGSSQPFASNVNY